MRRTEGNIRESFRHYRANSENPCDIKTYIGLNLKYLKFLMSKVFSGHEVTLPLRMGTLSIRGKKIKLRFREDGTPILPVDYAATKKLWKECPECEQKKQKVYHTNEHTDEVTYSFFWSKKSIFVNNKEFYSLIMTRDNKREVSRLVKKEGMQYAVKL
jgi:hypothetical protein